MATIFGLLSILEWAEANAHRLPPIDILYANLAIVAALCVGGILFEHYFGHHFPPEPGGDQR